MADNKVEIVLTAQDQTGAAVASARAGIARIGEGAAQSSTAMSSIATTANAAAVGIGNAATASASLHSALAPVEQAAQRLQKALDFTSGMSATATAAGLAATAIGTGQR